MSCVRTCLRYRHDLCAVQVSADCAVTKVSVLVARCNHERLLRYFLYRQWQISHVPWPCVIIAGVNPGGEVSWPKILGLKGLGGRGVFMKYYCVQEYEIVTLSKSDNFPEIERFAYNYRKIPRMIPSVYTFVCWIFSTHDTPSFKPVPRTPPVSNLDPGHPQCSNQVDAPMCYCRIDRSR